MKGTEQRLEEWARVREALRMDCGHKHRTEQTALSCHLGDYD